jgi:hypothetical protein
MANIVYNSFKKKIMDGSIDLDTDTIKASLHTSSYTPDADSHDFFDDLTNEVSSSGSYTAGISGGLTVANKAVTQDNTDDEGVFDGDDFSVTGFTGTFRWVVFRKDTGVAATSPLIGAVDLTSVSATAGTVSLAQAAEGILNIG